MDSIIFDVDGTLWDSTQVVADSWNLCLERENVPIPITPELLKQVFGRTLPDIARVIFADYPEPEQMRLIEACCDLENEILSQKPGMLYPGLLETLQGLSRKMPLFIVSNCQAGYIEAFLSSTGFGPYFSGHLCPGDTGEAKAANIRAICKKYDLKAPVYVGDTLGDFQACREAGVPFIFASWGFGEVEKPDARIDCLKDLLTLQLPE